MKPANAFTLVTKHGGKPCERVTKDTNVLIVGELGWPLQEDGRPSKSLTQAKSYSVPIVSERRFLEWVGPAEVVEQLSMFGLIRSGMAVMAFVISPPLVRPRSSLVLGPGFR
jgi:hypothetical protein